MTLPLPTGLQTTPPPLGEYTRQRAAADLYQRTLWGPLFCSIGCLITVWAGRYHNDQLFTLIVPVLAAFGVLGVLRWRHKPPKNLADAVGRGRWWKHHWWMVFQTSLVWCLFFLAVGFTERGATNAFVVAAMVTVAFTTASGDSLALARNHALAVITLQQLPALVIFWFYLPELRGMVLVMLAYWLYQSLHIHRRSLEYKSQVEVEHTLLASRAEIDRLSRQDALTELANRREYERAFQQHWNHAKRSSSDLGLLVLDLDHFKRINDRYGHLAGDACLRHVAQLLKTRFRRDTDTVARIGGEEFAVVLPGNNAVDVLRVAQAVCNELSASPLVFDGHSIGISASIGAGAMQWAGDASAEASFGRIDAACYAAKRLGRNQVVLA